MALTIKIVFLVLAILFFLTALGADGIKKAYVYLAAATVNSVLLLISMKTL